MKAYVLASGGIFGLIVAAHALRLLAEGTRVVRDPVFVLFTAMAAVMCVWAFSVYRSRQP